MQDNYQSFFGCQYPIIEACMNQASSISLAWSVNRHGAFPSIWCNVKDFQETRENWLEYINLVGNSQFLIPLSRSALSNYEVLKTIRDYGISHCEILAADLDGQYSDIEAWLNNAQVKAAIKYLQLTTKVILRIRDVIDAEKYSMFDAFSLKGSDSAGKTGVKPVRELFKEMIDLYPNSRLIPMGGVGTAEDVQWYMNNGALAVGVGTLFALTEESPLTSEVKNLLIRQTKPIVNLPDTEQNCVILADKIANENHWNRSESLKQGITGDGTQGHVYMGHGLNHVSHIRNCQELIDYLVSKL